jgi:hypothetical protein
MDYKELMRACSHQKLNHESRTNMRGSEMLDLPNVVDGACGIPVAQFLPSFTKSWFPLFEIYFGPWFDSAPGLQTVRSSRSLLLPFGIFLRLCSGR